MYLRGFAEDRYIRTTFDTGAVCSVISVENFTDRPFDRDEVIRYLDGRTRHRVFKSASGGDMNSYLVRADGISISGHYINRFYYYLAMDVGEELSLLGNDFIAKCRFSHSIDESIVVKISTPIRKKENPQPTRQGERPSLGRRRGDTTQAFDSFIVSTACENF